MTNRTEPFCIKCGLPDLEKELLPLVVLHTTLRTSTIGQKRGCITPAWLDIAGWLASTT